MAFLSRLGWPFLLERVWGPDHDSVNGLWLDLPWFDGRFRSLSNIPGVTNSRAFKCIFNCTTDVTQRGCAQIVKNLCQSVVLVFQPQIPHSSSKSFSPLGWHWQIYMNLILTWNRKGKGRSTRILTLYSAEERPTLLCSEYFLAQNWQQTKACSNQLTIQERIQNFGSADPHLKTRSFTVGPRNTNPNFISTNLNVRSVLSKRHDFESKLGLGLTWVGLGLS